MFSHKFQERTAWFGKHSFSSNYSVIQKNTHNSCSGSHPHHKDQMKNSSCSHHFAFRGSYIQPTPAWLCCPGSLGRAKVCFHFHCQSKIVAISPLALCISKNHLRVKMKQEGYFLSAGGTGRVAIEDGECSLMGVMEHKGLNSCITPL